MTMMTHIQRPPDRIARSSGAPVRAKKRGAAHLDAIKRFFAGVLVVLVATAAAGGVIALKSAYYLSHFSY